MMKSYALKELFGIEGLNKFLYVIRGESEIYYVGKAVKQCVSKRIISHIGHYYNNKNHRFAKMLFENYPYYFEWEVVVLSLDEAGKLTGEEYCCETKAEAGIYSFYHGKNMTPKGNTQRPSGKCNCNK